MFKKTQIATASAVITLGLTVFGATAMRALVFAPSSLEQERIPINNITRSDTASLPVRLIIPAIEVDTEIEHVGVGMSGNMAVPQNYLHTAWYRLGTTPGKVGSAVIAGHVTNGLRLPAAFSRLGELKTGDEVIVEKGDGTRARFSVTDVSVYKVSEVPRETLFNRKDGSYLNLITCEGEWQVRKRMYDHRTVVYTTLLVP